MQPRLFVPDPHPEEKIHNLFYFRFSPELLTDNVFGEPPFRNYFEKDALYADQAKDADAIVLPHNFTAITSQADAYIRRWADEGEGLGIPVFVFCFADFSHEVVFDPRVRVFLMSTYKSQIRPNDIVIPTTARTFDWVEKKLREKRKKPIVSFCGFAGFATRKQYFKYVLKNAFFDLQSLFFPLARAHKLGIYWRRVAMKTLEASPFVETNFIVRRSFSGSHKTIELSPEQARKEFIDSILDADFVLTPKGDGNYSNRFLETLSLGRIPVLIDTDVVLPLENIIPYEHVVVRVPMREVKNIASYVADFYKSHSEEEWLQVQKEARALFLTYLLQDVFFKYYFTHVLQSR